MAKQKQIGTTAHAIDTTERVIPDIEPEMAPIAESDEIGSPYIAYKLVRSGNIQIYLMLTPAVKSLTRQILPHRGCGCRQSHQLQA